MSTDTFILVYSTSHAIKIEKLLGATGIVCKLVPVPRHLSSDCGVCVRIATRNAAMAQSQVATAGVELVGIYTGDASGGYLRIA
jgi:hypothetical protein